MKVNFKIKRGWKGGGIKKFQRRVGGDFPQIGIVLQGKFWFFVAGKSQTGILNDCNCGIFWLLGDGILSYGKYIFKKLLISRC